MQAVVFIAFTATWCVHCKHLERDFSGDSSPQVMPVEENRELADSYEVTGYPTVIALVDGKEVARTVGYNSKAELQNWMEWAKNK